MASTHSSGAGQVGGWAARVGRRCLSLCVLVLLWWAAAAIARTPALLPGPWPVLAFAAHAAWHGPMLAAVAATLGRVAAAFLLAMTLGGALGVLAGRSQRFDAWFDPWLVIWLNLPLLVVVVLVYVWLGLTDAACVLAVTIAKVPTVAVTLREGARALDPALDELGCVFALPPWVRARRIVLPQLAPFLAAAARAGLSVTWKIALIAELLGRPNGVGFEINLLFQSFDVAGIMAYGLVFGMVMLAIELALVQPLERRANAWR